MEQRKMMLYVVYVILVYLMFENFKVFSMAEKNARGVDPMIVKAVLVGGGVYVLDMVIQKYVIEGFELADLQHPNKIIDEIQSRFFGNTDDTP